MPTPQLRAFLIQIGPRGTPRIEFGDLATSSAEAISQNLHLAEVGERVEAVPVREEPFPIIAVRQELATAELREVLA
jgi:hypothetical protein